MLSRRGFLTHTLGLAAANAAVVQAMTRTLRAQPRPPAGTIMAYVAAAGSLQGRQPGIHSFRFDPATGDLAPGEIFARDSNPGCLAFNPAKTHLYATTSDPAAQGSSHGSVAAFAIDPSDGRLAFLGAVDSGGAGPCYVSVHPSGKYALVANYAGGSVAVFPILTDGRLGPATAIKVHQGSLGPARAESAPNGSFAISGHEIPHAHMFQSAPDGRFALATDLALDRIFIWKFDERTGTLAANDPASMALPPGDGPRHFAFHPDGRRLFSIQEEGSTLVRFDYDPARGRLIARQSVSTLPPGFAGTSFASAIAISSDGRHVYAGNRLHDTIACFSIGENGALAYVGEEPTRGDYPAHFSLDPTGNFMGACNSKGDNVTTFRVDRENGGLAFTGKYTPVGNPTAIVFLDLGRTA